MRVFSHRLGYEIIELNVQLDHVHLLVMIPAKLSISSVCRADERKSRTGNIVLN